MKSNLKYAIVEEETIVGEEKLGQPVLVPSRDHALTQKVEAVLDAAFANGSMPT